ncbi:RICIN domain-containing protein [Dactylosporangium siamense]|uniref:Ricin B lectin domain-containing protein n=1 Tax=Dactylosporangium siamense TaxID=685454 RepID=A0A919PRL8_9ACTN|nr:RICIN domain-containing protein [Dactylosporangium siamense]GIG48452.1 hypothetical protein Dsi01nite_064930 [Dactylosporangium siamense]
MPTKTFRRTASLIGGAALATGLLAGFTAGPAAAEDVRPPVKSQVIEPAGTANVLVPNGANAGARIVSKPRIGKAAQTPDSQVWTKLFPKVIDANGKVVRNTTSYAFQPSLQPGSRPLCIDVVGDSQQAGAALELRPCDGTPSQAFVFLTNDAQTFVQNAGSGLQMTVEANGTVVQRGFFKRVPNESREQTRERNRLTNTQLFRVGPREVGVGGA